ncbi:hypothetical protein GH722_01665 [Alphaproteobacteria bacterium HT1-32]|nr:hypothetical protein [Alphaproteobacteria bacterium HT1-32]
MIDWVNMSAGLDLLLNWQTPLVIFAGMMLGLIIGVIPGMTAALGLAIILPLTFSMDALTALILMTSVYTGSLTGGGILAILINTPGTPGAVATTFDGYPMARQGRHNLALGLQIAASVIGGLLSYLVLLVAIHPMTWLALQFGSGEMLALTIFVIIFVGVLQGKYLTRSLFAGALGLLMSTIGTSVATGVTRGTMGFSELEDGLPLILCVIGMFAIPELISLVTRPAISDSDVSRGNNLRELWQGVTLVFRRVRIWAQGSIIGIVVGVLPAAGSTLASLSSYSLAKKLGRRDQKFGEGEPDGVIAAESANNASEGGAMAILMALGIPGSASTAVILGGFLLHGLVPGIGLFRDNGPLVYGLILGNMLQMLLLGFFAVIVAYFVGRVVTVPSRILVPLLLVLMSVGAFAFRGLMFDVFVLFAFGLIGWFFRRYHFTLLSFMIGLFLGRQLDEDMERVLILFGDDPLSALASPITAILTVSTVGLLSFILLKGLFARKSKGL